MTTETLTAPSHHPTNSVIASVSKRDIMLEKQACMAKIAHLTDYITHLTEELTSANEEMTRYNDILYQLTNIKK